MSNNAAPQSIQPIVARLRHLAKLLGFDLPVVLNEAADRIEELEKAARIADKHLDALGYGEMTKARKVLRAALPQSFNVARAPINHGEGG